MGTLPKKDFFQDGIYIVRGLKDCDGNLYTFVKTNSKFNINKVNIGDITIISEFEPVPYSEFTSLDDEYTEGYERTYLKVKLSSNLTQKQIDNLSTRGIMYYQFGEQEVKILKEFRKPFQYTLNYLNSGEGDFGVYGPTTWLIHDKTRGKEERKAMEEILSIAHEYYKTTPYSLDISLDSNTLKYISYLRELDDANKITYGNSGFIDIKKEDIIQGAKEGHLKELDLLYLAGILRDIGVLFHHPLFTTDFYKNNIEGEEVEQHFTIYLCDHDLKDIFESTFDIGYLAERNIIKLLGQSTEHGYEKYETNIELVADTDYHPETEYHDPYEYYCCYECDGHFWDTEDVAYDYEVDEQVDLLSKIVDMWGEYLTGRHIKLFDAWSRDIFTRYLESVQEHSFVEQLTKA